MLFYNHKYEFIGIDEDGLKLLNYATLDDLLSVCGDVADLFAKEPGYIHNFKSFKWIDFLLHADSDARSAIVHARGRTFSCTLNVHSLYLCSNPDQNGYMIDMTHIQTISGDEAKPHTITPKVQSTIKPAITKTPPIEKSLNVLPDYTHITPTTLSEPNTLDIPSFSDSEFETAHEDAEDLYAKLSLPLGKEEPIEPAGSVVQEPNLPPKVERPMLGDVYYSSAEKEFLTHLKVDKSYRFDPNVAAHELGLPVDLILEFIGDFIQQSYEFKEELFEATLKGDLNNVKILSHKLKGVAANLRIEDAFETLSIINTSSDTVEIEANLKYFYTIIAKLEGKETVSVESTPSAAPVSQFDKTPISQPISLDDDIYAFALKEDETPIAKEHSYFEPPMDEPSYELTATTESILETTEEIVELLPENTKVPKPATALHYDKLKISGELGIEKSFLDELIDEYKRDASIVAQDIGAAIGAFDTHAWKKHAIHLKGISDNLRLNEISEELAILSKTNDAQEANQASKCLNAFLEQL
ncbi:MAG: hypothetical protein IE884_02570 [Sulfuricurvum sp.]|nr:hypothetical protein [Sulfuricurvum sp.]